MRGSLGVNRFAGQQPAEQDALRVDLNALGSVEGGLQVFAQDEQAMPRDNYRRRLFANDSFLTAQPVGDVLGERVGVGRRKPTHLDDPELEHVLQHRRNGPTGHRKYHHMARMTMHHRLPIGELAQQAKVHLGLARYLALARQLLTVQVGDDHLLRAQPPLIFTACVAGGDTDQVANPGADVAARGIGEITFVHQPAQLGDAGAGSVNEVVHVFLAE